MTTAILGRGEFCGDGGSGAGRPSGKGSDPLHRAVSAALFQTDERKILLTVRVKLNQGWSRVSRCLLLDHARVISRPGLQRAEEALKESNGRAARARQAEKRWECFQVERGRLREIILSLHISADLSGE